MRNHDWKDLKPQMIGMWQDALLRMTDMNVKCFSGKHQPCPNCMGRDRYRFDNNRFEKGDGGAICNQCGSGDGMYWLQKLTGWSFGCAVAACADFLRAAPPERIAIAKKNVKLIPDNSYSATASESDISRVIERTIEVPTHIYTLEHGIAPYPLRVLDSRIVVPIVNVNLNEAHGQVVNLAMIDSEGNQSFLAGKMSYGAVSVIGADVRKAIYLCAEWVDAWHVHHATGAQVWCCHTVNNVHHVAYKFQKACLSGRLRMACNYDFNELCEAEKSMCYVIIPACNGSIREARQFQRTIFDPTGLLDEMSGVMA